MTKQQLNVHTYEPRLPVLQPNKERLRMHYVYTNANIRVSMKQPSMAISVWKRPHAAMLHDPPAAAIHGSQQT